MELWKQSLTLWCFLLLAGGCQPAQTSAVEPVKKSNADGVTPATDLTWEVFNSPESGYSVLFPGKPAKAPPVADPSRITYLVELPATSLFMVSSFAADSSNAEAILKAVWDALTNGCEVLKDESLQILGYPGREFAILDADENVSHCRLVLANDQMYLVMFVTPKAKYSADDGNLAKFLDSFQLIK